MSEQFKMVWLGGNKYLVGIELARQIEALQQYAQEEHDERIRLEERLKAEKGRVEILTEMMKGAE